MNFRSVLRNCASVLLVAAGAAASAAPVSFSVTPSSFTPGSGYGTGVGDLDVSFSANGGSTSFSLANAGASSTFKFGTVTFNETGLILPAETNNLGVSAIFSFLDPLAGLQTVTASGTAFVGPVVDALVDFTIVWNTLTVAFGNGGSFEISMNSLSFSRGGQSLDQNATIKLLAAPAAAVPEPGTAALALLALAVVGGRCRRRASGQSRTPTAAS